MPGERAHGQRNTRQKGRPLRTQRVDVRFSREELAALDVLCKREGLTRSAALRSVATSCPTRLVIIRNADLERVASELRSIGINVNQVARKVNSSRDLSMLSQVKLESRLKELSISVGEVAREVSRVRDKLERGGEVLDGDD